MKGRTACPKCKHEFVLDLQDNNKKHEIVCPNCDNEFTVQAKYPESKSDEECSWEEHGEPRKTILSSIKTKTNQPRIAAILLVCVFAIGITTSIFSEAFIISTMDLASEVGMTGSVEISVIDESKDMIKNASVKINGLTGFTNDRGIYSVDNVQLGILTLEVSALEFKTQSREILVIPFFNSENTINMSDYDDKIYFNTSGCSIVLAIFSVFAFLGFIICLKRQHFYVAIIVTIISIFSVGFFFLGSILSIIAIVLIMKSKEEFENGKKGKSF